MVRLPTTGHRFVVLDGLRGVAALVVLYFHLVQQHDLTALPFAGLAVDFFYMLSGFVVAFAYEQRLVSGTISLSSFARIRILRLYPLALLGILVGITLGGLAAFNGRITYEQLALGGILGLLLLPSYVFPQWATAYPFNMASWSLSFELLVNALYGAIARGLTTRRLTGLIACSAVVLVWVAFMNNGIGGGNNQDNFAYGFGRVMFPFFAGVWLYRFRFPQRMAPWVGGGMIVGLAGLLIVPVVHGAGVIGVLYVLLLFPAMIAIGAAVEVGPRLGWACRLGGELSYPVYILQSPVLLIGAELLKHWHVSSLGACLFGIGEASVVSVFAYLALKFYDEPLQSYFKGRLQATYVLQNS